jgi:hypothetical protein
MAVASTHGAPDREGAAASSPGAAQAQTVTRVKCAVVQAGPPRGRRAALHETLTTGAGRFVADGRRVTGFILHADEYGLSVDPDEDTRMRLEVTDAVYYPPDEDDAPTEPDVERVLLDVRVDRSTDDDCPEHKEGRLLLRTSAPPSVPVQQQLFSFLCQPFHVHEHVGTRKRRGRLRIEINARCVRAPGGPARAVRLASARSAPCDERPATPAAELTLIVNGQGYTGRPELDTPPIPIAPQTPVTMAASIPAPLPAGWSIEVRHANDPESPGNGVYHLACRATSRATCPPVTRPGPDASAGEVHDYVFASLLRPDGSVHARVSVHLLFQP